MKIIKFVTIVILITAISLAVPYVIHDNINASKYQTRAEGAQADGLIGYIRSYILW